jgi:cytoskeletal protein RodZ
MPPVQEAAIMQGLVMDYKQRIKNAGDLYYLLYVYGADTNSTVEGLQKKVQESATDVILKKMKAEHTRSKSRMGMIIATAVVLVLGCLIIAVRQISKNMSAENESRPVVITEAAESGQESTSDGDVSDEEITAENLIAYRDMLYESINSDRAGSPAEINDDYQGAADYAVEICVSADCATTDEWNEKMLDAAQMAMEKYSVPFKGSSAVGWVLRTYGNNMTIDSVKQDIYDYIEEINSGVENPIDLSNCSEFGVSVGIHSDGTYFWMIIYR